METFSVPEAARLLGVSADTVRRWVTAGRLPARRSDNGRNVVAGADLALLAQSSAEEPELGALGPTSARNRFVGLVTAVEKDKVMAKVDLVCGMHRVVSLMSREAADELGLSPGVLAVATIKATNVVVERPDH